MVQKCQEDTYRAKTKTQYSKAVPCKLLKLVGLQMLYTIPEGENN